MLLLLGARPLLHALQKARADQPFRPSTFTASPTRASAQRATGCGQPPATSPRETHRAAGRDYIVVRPEPYDPSRAYPVVVAVHGWHSTAAGFADWFAMERFVHDAALVLYPETRPGAYGVWNLSGSEDLDAIDAALDDASSIYCVDRQRVLAFGFSYGGKLVHHLGCTHPERVKAISVGDGSMGMPEVGCGAVPALITHRTHDNDELYAWGWSATERWIEGAGCSREADVIDEAHTCRTFRGCRADAPVTFCEDTYTNLTWPPAWNHTVREEYRALTWEWFDSLP